MSCGTPYQCNFQVKKRKKTPNLPFFSAMREGSHFACSRFTFKSRELLAPEQAACPPHRGVRRSARLTRSGDSVSLARGRKTPPGGRRAGHEPRPPCVSGSPCVCRALLPANWASDSEKVPEGHLPIIPREISPFSAACVPRSEHVINYVARGLVAESCSRQHRGR